MGKLTGTACSAEREPLAIGGALGPAAQGEDGLDIPVFDATDWQEQRRARIKEIVGRLDEQVKIYAANDSTWRGYLEGMARIHSGSLNNRLWRAGQLAAKNKDAPGFDPHALTLSKTQWAALGRTVKDEHLRKGRGSRPAQDDRYAALQLMPKVIVLKDKDGVPRVDANGKELKRVFYDTFVAYHLDATEGEPLPEHPWKHTTGSDEDASLLIGHLAAVIDAQGLPPVKMEAPGSGARGDYDPATGQIRLDPSFPLASQASTLLHEVLHHTSGDQVRGDSEEARKQEIATQSATHAILSLYQLHDRDCTFPYLASWCKGEPKRIKELDKEIERRTSVFFETLDPIAAKKREGMKAVQAERQRKAAERKKAKAKKRTPAAAKAK